MINIFTILKLNGYPVEKARKYYSSIEKIKDKRSWQENKKWDIFRWHYENNTGYRKLISEGVTEWGDISIIKKENLRGELEDILPNNVKKRSLYTGSTSGSVGTPMNFARDKFSHVLVWLNAFANYEKDGISVNDLEARFFGVPHRGISNLKERIKDLITKRDRFVIFDISDKMFEAWILRFEKKEFKYIYGYTNTLVQFAKYLLNKGIILKDICKSLGRCIVTSETCSASDCTLMSQAFGVSVSNEYGASEVSVIGYKRDEIWEVSDELLYLEVVDDLGKIIEDETPGRLLCTLLHNRATPIIRYDIGDIVTLKRSNGRTYITTLQGRTNDICILPSGRKIPGLTFYYAVHDALKNENGVKEHQVLQLTNNSFEVRIISDMEISFEVISNIKKAFKSYLEEGLDVKIVRVNKINRSKSGKFKHFINVIQ